MSSRIVSLVIIVALFMLITTVPSSTNNIFISAQLQQYKICESAEGIIAADNGDSFICYNTAFTAPAATASKYNTATGALIWHQPSVPAVGAGQVHVFDQENFLFFQSSALNLTTGKVMWANPNAGHECFSSYYPQSVLIDNVKGRIILVVTCPIDMVVPIWTLDAISGELLWTTKIPRWTFSHAANIVRHTLVVSVTNKAHAFDILTGDVLWVNDKLPPSDSRFGSTFIALIEQNFEAHSQLTVPQSNVLYDLADVILGRYGVPGTSMFALSRSNGTLLWNSSTQGWTVASNSLIQTLECSPSFNRGQEGKSLVPTTAILIMTDLGQIQLREALTGNLITYSNYSYPDSVSHTTSSSVPGTPTSFVIALDFPGILYVKSVKSEYIDVFSMAGFTYSGVWAPLRRILLPASSYQLLASGFFDGTIFGAFIYSSTEQVIKVSFYETNENSVADLVLNVVIPAAPASSFSQNPKIGSGGMVVSSNRTAVVVFISGSGVCGYKL